MANVMSCENDLKTERREAIVYFNEKEHNPDKFCCSKTEKKVPRYPKVLTTLGICVLCIFEFLFWLYVS